MKRLFSHYNRSFAAFALATTIGALGILPLAAQDPVANEHSSQIATRDAYRDITLKTNETGDQLTVSFAYLPATPLKHQEVAFIYPAVVSDDGARSLDLQPIIIAGPTRYRVIQRHDKLNNEMKGLPEINGKLFRAPRNTNDNPVQYSVTVPVEEWMAGARLIVREQRYGCAECELEQFDSLLGPLTIFKFGPNDFRFDYIAPKALESKCYEEALEVRVNFEWDKDVIKRDFKRNSAELDSLESFLNQALNIKGATLSRTIVRGYASPEGEFNYNKRLAKRRADALVKHANEKFPTLSEATGGPAEVEGVGEDWDGLRQALTDATDMQNKDEIIAIIDRFNTDVKRESAIKNLDNGYSYRYLLQNYYPPLRRTTVKLRFDVRPYTEEEIPEIYATKPGCLSPKEFYLLANSYIKEQKDPTDVYAKAVEIYPDDNDLKIDYALALIQYRKDGSTAAKLLEPILSSDERARRPLAMAYYLMGDHRRADEVAKPLNK